MKLLRLKITDPAGFRSLPCGFEHHFRTEWTLHEEEAQSDGFAPFVCAGPNGSGKSNLLEALAAIFFQLEVRRVQGSFLPEALLNKQVDLEPAGFELDYLIKVRPEYRNSDSPEWAQVNVWKSPGESVRFQWANQGEFEVDVYGTFKGGHADIVFPDYVLGYSSGENEILSLPFFKMRFVQFDEYWNALVRQLPYPGRPDARLAYLDSEFSQAILLCNLLFQDEAILQPFRTDVGIEALREFRIIIKRSIPITGDELEAFDQADDDQKSERRNRLSADARKRGQTDSEVQQKIGDWIRREVVRGHPALAEVDGVSGARYRLNLLHLLEGDEKSSLALSVSAPIQI